MFGGIHFEGPACTEFLVDQLKAKLVHILTQLDKVFKLCDKGAQCDYSQNLHVLCKEKAHHLDKRSLTIERQKVHFIVEVRFNISKVAYSMKSESYEGSMKEEFDFALKKDNSTADFNVQSIDIQIQSRCTNSQVLLPGKSNNDDLCLECPVGHQITRNNNKCTPCELGTYRSLQQTSCVACPGNSTTYISAATSQSDCQSLCEKGSYYNNTAGKCVLCSRGTFQPRQGQTSCCLCAAGQTTSTAGAISSHDCFSPCGAGQEITVAGNCKLCPHGTYRNLASNVSHCLPCGYHFTTLDTGASDESECSVLKCDKGTSRNSSTGLCTPCPVGTFQVSRGGTSCEPCGVDLTTVRPGATSRLECISGEIDECFLNIHNCDAKSRCVDQPQGFRCVCKQSARLDGSCVDSCDILCKQLKLCEEGEEQEIYDESNNLCKCNIETCDNPTIRTLTFQSLIISSIVVTAVATSLTLLAMSICIYQRYHECDTGLQVKIYREDVKIYREEKELVAFTNKAFESLPLDSGVNLKTDKIHFPPMKSKIPTRWHRQSFVSNSNPTYEESTEL